MGLRTSTRFLTPVQYQRPCTAFSIPLLCRTTLRFCQQPICNDRLLISHSYCLLGWAWAGPHIRVHVLLKPEWQALPRLSNLFLHSSFLRHSFYLRWVNPTRLRCPTSHQPGPHELSSLVKQCSKLPAQPGHALPLLLHKSRSCLSRLLVCTYSSKLRLHSQWRRPAHSCCCLVNLGDGCRVPPRSPCIASITFMYL